MPLGRRLLFATFCAAAIASFGRPGSAQSSGTAAPDTAASSAPAMPGPRDNPQAPSAPALPPAGIVPANVSLDVTGNPAVDATALYGLIRDALDRRIRPTLRYGASINYGPVVPWPLLPLAFGQRAAVNVTVTLAGDDATATVTGVTTVTLNSVAAPAFEPAVLYLSDDPEYLPGEGLVFHGNVPAARPARLYYYHSDLGLPRDVDVVLTALAPARVHLISSEGGPDLDVMAVGHSVTRDFLQYRSEDEGVIVDVSPSAPFVVRHALLLPGELVAGNVDMQVVGGGPVTVSVIGSTSGNPPGRFLAGPRVPYDGHRRHGAFDLSGYGTTVDTYTVGGPAAVARYGGRLPTLPNIDATDDGHDYGDYGVVRHITFTLANPTDDPHLVYLYEKPLGGSVRSTFVVDGRLKELDCVRVPRPYGIATYQLPPHSTGASTTVTMTEGGSSYPLEFGVTEAQPFPYVPPPGAADGCSPVSS